jgi:hypothetical protein
LTPYKTEMSAPMRSECKTYFDYLGGRDERQALLETYPKGSNSLECILDSKSKILSVHVQRRWFNTLFRDISAPS